jgi:hypothetical protein
MKHEMKNRFFRPVGIWGEEASVPSSAWRNGDRAAVQR